MVQTQLLIASLQIWKLRLGEVKRPDSDHRGITAGRIGSWGAGSWVEGQKRLLLQGRMIGKGDSCCFTPTLSSPTVFFPVGHLWPRVKAIEGSESLRCTVSPTQPPGLCTCTAHTTHSVLHLGPQDPSPAQAPAAVHAVR